MFNKDSTILMTMTSVITVTKNYLDKSVVDNAGEYVDDVEDGEGHQQVVEGGPHLWLPGGTTQSFYFSMFLLHECWHHYEKYLYLLTLSTIVL